MVFLSMVASAIAMNKSVSAGKGYFSDQCSASLVDSDLKKVDSIYAIANQDLCKPSCLCNTDSSFWPVTQRATIHTSKTGVANYPQCLSAKTLNNNFKDF